LQELRRFLLPQYRYNTS